MHKDPKRRAAYIARHRVNENWNDPHTAGFWSRWLLWGDHTSLTANARAISKKLRMCGEFSFLSPHMRQRVSLQATTCRLTCVDAIS
eukprot:scaffold5118_cov118-Isochrysis_galbana.AAC.7